MSRPKPKIIFKAVDRNYKSEEILEADAIYAVCYDGKPINLRTSNLNKLTRNGEPESPKYKKCSFSNPGHAFNLAERLNELFDTNLFAVHKMISGEVVTEDS